MKTDATTNSFYQQNQGAATNTDAATNECYNGQFLSIKSGCCNEHGRYNAQLSIKPGCYNQQFLSIKPGCYNEHGGILFTTETSIIVFTAGRLFMLFQIYIYSV